MKKRLRTAVLNDIAASGANILNDSTSGKWSVVNSDGDILLGSFPLGKLVRTESFDPVAENRQVVAIGASATKETIAASTRYKIEIGNPADKYESWQKFAAVHAYTTPVALSGDADADRLNVYTQLVNKVNSYAGNNCAAYLLHEFDFTGGADSGDGTPTIGAIYTQATSSATAKIAKIALSSGTWAGDNAAGTIWVYQDADCTGTISSAALNWTGETTIDFDQTVSTLVTGTGMVVIDDAGYFVSSLGRNGANWVAATQGFSVSQFEVIEAPVYAEGIGSVLAALAPRYDHSMQDAISGNLDYELQDGQAFDTTKTYRKYVFTVSDGDENALTAEKEASYQQVVLFANYAELGGDLDDLQTAIAALT